MMTEFFGFRDLAKFGWSGSRNGDFKHVIRHGELSCSIRHGYIPELMRISSEWWRLGCPKKYVIHREILNSMNEECHWYNTGMLEVCPAIHFLMPYHAMPCHVLYESSLWFVPRNCWPPPRNDRRIPTFFEVHVDPFWGNRPHQVTKCQSWVATEHNYLVSDPSIMSISFLHVYGWHLNLCRLNIPSWLNILSLYG